MAGVARGDIDLHFVWQVALLARLGPVGAAVVSSAGVAFGSIDVHLCGRRGIWRHGPLLRVAGVALVAQGWLWLASGASHGIYGSCDTPCGEVCCCEALLFLCASMQARTG